MRLFLAIVLLFASELSATERIAFIYYYAWYGNPAVDGGWIHWTENNHRPPLDLASTFYPRLGPYSSNDPAVIDQHMRWIAQTGIDVVIYSWWGRKDPTNFTAPAVFQSAADYDLKITFLIEPYDGRSIQSITNDIRYLNDRFENHPAYFRLARNTSSSRSSRARPMFLLYAPHHTDHELRKLSANIHETANNSLLLIQSQDLSRIAATNVDGIFLYNPADLDLAGTYKTAAPAAAKTGDLYIPSVAPGFNKNRLARKKFEPYLSRKKGATYDLFWKQILASRCEFVSIISFNEWHEGTQIEPAIKGPERRLPYLSYHGTYNKKGIRAQESFLQRTARWIRMFREAL